MFIALVHRTKRYVILSGAQSAESKNLRIIDTFQQIFGAKILRLASLAQDDKTEELHDKLKFDFIPNIVPTPDRVPQRAQHQEIEQFPISFPVFRGCQRG